MSYGKLTDAMLSGKLLSYTLMGGYPLAYVDSNNCVLCAKCADEALNDPEETEDRKPLMWFIHLEGADVQCENCFVEIESAYGDPEEEENG